MDTDTIHRSYSDSLFYLDSRVCVRFVRYSFITLGSGMHRHSQITEECLTSRILRGISLSSLQPHPSRKPLPHPWQTLICSPFLKLGHLGWLQVWAIMNITSVFTVSSSHGFIVTFYELAKEDLPRGVLNALSGNGYFQFRGNPGQEKAVELQPWKNCFDKSRPP